ncbi:hypothetical protein MTP03_01520 [Tsukamurella sp. PLM1]|nr:hypothetical protein MTP03_01520 [Tsukamurella sp. PLM1]
MGPSAGAQRDDHDVQLALGAADRVLHRVLRLEELREAQLLQLAPQVRDGVVRQEDGGVLVDVLDQVLRVEVVAVQVGDVEVVDVAERLPVQLGVVREREPRREVGRIDPRIAQDGACGGGDVETRVPDAGDLHSGAFRLRVVTATG